MQFTNTSFILGKCQCGCQIDIPLRTKQGIIQRFKRWHGGNLIKKGEHKSPSTERQKGNVLGFQRGQANFMYGKTPLNYKGKIEDKCGYILIHSPNHPYRDSKDYVREHRLIMEKKLGRYLNSNEQVHHINGNKQDNRIENLELMSRVEHSKHHFPKGSRFGANSNKEKELEQK